MELQLGAVVGQQAKAVEPVLFDPDFASVQLFHECSHLMMETLDTRLKSQAQAAGKELSHDAPHTILFYTVGEVVRRTVSGRALCDSLRCLAARLDQTLRPVEALLAALSGWDRDDGQGD